MTDSRTPKQRLSDAIEAAVAQLDIGTGEVIEVLESLLAEYRREF